MTQPLTINNWQLGTAPSPHLGFGMVRNAQIDTIKGSVVPNYKPVTNVLATTVSTFTADAGTDVCTGASFTTTANTTGCAVTLTTTGTLPAGLSLATTYFVIRVDQNAGTFKLATTLANADAGTAIDITDAGTGTHTITPTAMGTVRHMVEDQNGTKYALDSNGRVWKSSGTFRLLTGNTLTNASGQGLALFVNSDASKTFLFVFRNATIDVCDLAGPTWTNGWQNMNNGSGFLNSHHAIVGQDNIIYACDGRYIVSIKENSGAVFAPGTAATYTYSVQALDLPQGEIAEWLEELNISLLVAGKTYSNIYPWDRASSSFAIPLKVPEKGVYRMKNIGNTVFVLAGLKGNIYTTQGSLVSPFLTLPEYILGNGSSNLVAWGGIAVKAGTLLFGVGVVQNTANSGIYGILSDGRLVIDNQPSTGAANVTAILDSNGDFYTFGYAGGADTLDTNRFSSYETVVQSAFYQLANKTEKASYSELEIQVDRPVNGGSVRIGYRTSLTGNFTTLATFSMDSTNVSYNADIGLIDLENIQIQAEISGSENNSRLVGLREVRLIP